VDGKTRRANSQIISIQKLVVCYGKVIEAERPCLRYTREGKVERYLIQNLRPA
jgi:hypothetical protein